MQLLASLSLFVRLQQLNSHWKDFHDTWYLMVFREFGEKIRVLIENSWKIESVTGAWSEQLSTLVIMSCWNLPIMRNVSDIICRENRNSYFMFNILFSPKWCRLRDNVKKYGTAGQNRSRSSLFWDVMQRREVGAEFRDNLSVHSSRLCAA